MRWIKVPSTRSSVSSSRRKVRHRVLSTGYWVLLVALASLSAARSAEERHISVYSPVAIYTLPLVERSGHEYVGLLELLEPLGRVSSETNGRSLRLRYNAIDAEFTAGKTRAKIHGHDFDFSAPFLIENSRGMIPLNSLSTMLPRFLGAPVNFHESARRLFVGDVGIQPSFRLDAGNPTRMVVTFGAPVNPTISTEPGKLRMVFKHDPLVSPGSPSIAFDSKIITHADYSESDGAAELDVEATESLMASFSSDRRTITVSVVQQGAGASGPPATPGGVEQATGSAQISPSVPSAITPSSGGSSAPHRILAVVDPGHGGDERGAALSETLAEKDVTLGFGRLLRHELETRGFAVLLLRDGDVSSNLDQRAAAANTAHAGIYISLHAVSQGNGARVYTALLPVEGQNKGAFHAWNAAQAAALPISRIVSAAIMAEMQKREFPVRASSASLRPLNNVFMPAVAVELAPATGGVSDLTSANYQQRAASAIADAVATVRDRLGVQQ
jgi:N-acetylmuramoyl-L-alanine amidase